MNNKAVIYSRVSTTNGQTVDNQLKVLREVAEKKGLEIVKEIVPELEHLHTVKTSLEISQVIMWVILQELRLAQA